MGEQCGNFRVEAMEECDAGLLGMVRRDPCCNEDCFLANDAVCRWAEDCSVYVCVCVCECVCVCVHMCVCVCVCVCVCA